MPESPPLDSVGLLALARKIHGTPNHDKLSCLQEIVGDLSDEGRSGDDIRIAFAISTFFDSGALSQERQVVNVDNSSTNTLNVGGNATAVALGDGASLKARDISAFNTTIESSKATPQLKEYLKAARQELEAWEAEDPDSKSAVLEQFDRFSVEATKENPNKTLLSMTWSGIESVAKTAVALAPFAELGTKIMAYCLGHPN